MTTYTAISSGSLAVGKPLTSAIALALRDNPIAIAEGDASVPVNLLQTRLLGTLTTTSGSTQTLSSLTLTPYKFLLFVANGVSTTTSTSASIGIGSSSTLLGTMTTTAHTISGTVWVELATGLATATTQAASASNVQVEAIGYSNATTSVSVATTNGTFDAGSIRIYGVK